MCGDQLTGGCFRARAFACLRVARLDWQERCKAEQARRVSFLKELLAKLRGVASCLFALAPNEVGDPRSESTIFAARPPGSLRGASFSLG